MATWFMSSAQYALVTQWAASTAHSVGDLIRQRAAPAIGSERVFRCTTAGTSGATEPTWTLTTGGTTTDGTVTWTEVTGNSTYGWTAPLAGLDGLIAHMAAGDIVFIADTHNENQTITGVKTWVIPGTASNPSFLYSVDHTITSPGAGNLKAGAFIGTNPGASNFNTSVHGNVHGYGITWANGLGSAALFNLAMGTSAGGWQSWDTCTFYLASSRSGGGNGLIFYSQIHNNCKYRYGSNGDNIQASLLYSYNCSIDATDTSGTFTCSAGWAAYANSLFQWFVEDCDFSALAGAVIPNNQNFGSNLFSFKRCKFASGITFALAQTGPWVENRADFIQCDSGTSYLRNERYYGNGNSVISTVVARSSGAQDNSTPVSHKCLTVAANRWVAPFPALPIAIWPMASWTVGTAINVTVEMLADPRDFAALPNNDDVWIDVEYLGSATSTQGSRATGTKANNLATGSAQTASTASWAAGSAATRSNSTVYSLGSIIQLASNHGRLFVCTTAGTSAAAEPGGYALAADGSAVPDGTATFTAMWRFKQTITVTPQATGLIYVQPRIGKTSVLNGIYIDPLVTLS